MNISIKKIKNINVKRLSIILSLVVVMMAIIINPSRYISSCIEGILVFANNVLPALFPFLFITKLLTSLGLATTISRMFSKVTCRIYRCHSVGSYVLIMSILSGYPIGAKLISDLYQEGIIDNIDAKKIMTFTSMSGPIFTIGTLGAGILKSTKYGYILLISQIVASLINGLIFRGRNKETTNVYNARLSVNVDNILSHSMSDAILSILTVGGYIAIFYLLSDILYDIGILRVMSDMLDMALSKIGVDSMISRAIPISIVEMTHGILEMSASSQDIVKIPLISGVISFGGLSIILQSMSYLEKAHISLIYLLLTKTTQALIAIVISLVLMLIFP